MGYSENVNQDYISKLYLKFSNMRDVSLKKQKRLLQMSDDVIEGDSYLCHSYNKCRECFPPIPAPTQKDEIKKVVDVEADEKAGIEVEEKVDIKTKEEIGIETKKKADTGSLVDSENIDMSTDPTTYMLDYNDYIVGPCNAPDPDAKKVYCKSCSHTRTCENCRAKYQCHSCYQLLIKIGLLNTPTDPSHPEGSQDRYHLSDRIKAMVARCHELSWIKVDCMGEFIKEAEKSGQLPITSRDSRKIHRREIHQIVDNMIAADDELLELVKELTKVGDAVKYLRSMS